MLDWKLKGRELVLRGLGFGGLLLCSIESGARLSRREALEGDLSGSRFESAWEVVVQAVDRTSGYSSNVSS